jgi:hypothetical protein
MGADGLDPEPLTLLASVSFCENQTVQTTGGTTRKRHFFVIRKTMQHSAGLPGLSRRDGVPEGN